jgi:asparagine synthase (glutamine-hydrolysing)
MSGIFGEVGLHDPVPSPGVVGLMADRLADDGAQAEGLCADRSSILGYRRIRSRPHSAGRPDSRVDERLGLSVVLDGSILNAAELRARLAREGYSPRSESQAEMVLHAFDAWGERFVERLEGAFAFVIRDRRRGRTVLGRDRLGIKPLYYSRTRMRLRFASSLPALAVARERPGVIDPIALHHYLSFGSVVPPPRTIIAGIRKLMPATVLSVGDDGRSASLAYWAPEFRSGTAEAVDPAPEQWLLDALARAGAGDSPAGDPGEAPPETGDAADMDALVEELHQCVAATSEPVANRSVLQDYRWGRQVAARNASVLVSDFGLDLLFGRRRDYPAVERPADAAPAYARRFFACDHDAIREMLEPEWVGVDHSLAFVVRHFARPGAPDPIDRMRRLDLTVLGVENALRSLESAAAAWGLELRLPFLDHRLVERAARRSGPLPFVADEAAQRRIASTQHRRRVARTGASGRVRGISPRSRGSDPASRAFMRAVLRRPESRSWTLFREPFLERLLGDPEAHRTRTGDVQLWPIAVLDAWRQAHGV